MCDVWRLSGCLSQNPDDPPKALKELVVSLTFDVERYGELLRGMRGPIV